MRKSFAPASLSRSIAATEEFPVASMGSTAITRRLSSSGDLAVVFDRFEGFLVAVHTDKPDPGGRDDLEYSVKQSVTRPQNRDKGKFLAV